jgi:predicted glycosyltransferase
VDGRRVLFYSHNGVGLGHLQRQLDLARGFRARHPESAVLLVTGSHAASMFEFPEGIDFVKLPSLAMVDRYRNWRPRDLPLPIDDVVRLRTEILEQTVERFAPELLVADFMPAGPYGELLPALDALERVGGCAVAGFRDVIDDPAFVRDLWEETDVYDTLERSYDAICVYGDPLTVDFARAYGLDDDLHSRLHYCGYLGRPPRREAEAVGRERPFVLASCGGGADGFPLLEAFVSAAAELRRELGGTWLAVSGPLMPYADHLRLGLLGEAHGVSVERFVPELRAQAALADCVIAMPGYNTVCDILSHGLRAVVVPRNGPSREQSLRAARLQEWGLARVVTRDQLDGAELALAVREALAADAPPAAPVPLDGIERALDVFDEVALHRTAPVAVASGGSA